MSQIELVLALMLAVVVLAAAAERINIPYPIVLVIGGLVLGAITALPNVELDPDAVFLLFLPPALFSAALTTDWPRFREEVRPIFALAVVLVLTTMAGVAAVAFAVMGHMSWDVAFVLGAVVSPPDAVSTLAIVKRLNVPRQLVTILEGESLINDVTALIAYRYAVAAVVAGSFTLWRAGLDFLLSAAGGFIIGIAVSVIISTIIINLIDDPTIANAASVLTPVAAYFPAEHFHFSGVLAVVTAGLVFARATSRRFSAATRLQAEVVWQFVMFVIDGLVFILIGLQLPTVIAGLSEYSNWQLAVYGVAVSLATILVRVIFVSLIMNPRRPWPMLHLQGMSGSWSGPAVLSWAGPRGILTLGTALALPYTTETGQPFPDRDLVIFLAFCVILATLVGQGLSLSPLISRLRFPPDDTKQREINLAARAVIIAGIHRLDELESSGELPDGAGETQRAALKARLLRYPVLDPAASSDGGVSSIQRKIVAEVTAAERAELQSMQARGLIGEAARRSIERELDLTEARVFESGSSH
jgi:CPA1 family monovalent cation:H+ antiporter